MIGRPLLIPRPISQDQHPQLPVLHAAFYLCRQQGVTDREPILAFFYLSLLTFRSVQWKYYGDGIRLHVRTKLSIDFVGLSIETLASKTFRRERLPKITLECRCPYMWGSTSSYHYRNRALKKKGVYMFLSLGALVLPRLLLLEGHLFQRTPVLTVFVSKSHLYNTHTHTYTCKLANRRTNTK